MKSEVYEWINFKLSSKGYIRAEEDREDFVLSTGAGATKFSNWMKKAGCRFDHQTQKWTRLQDTVERRDDGYTPPSNPTTHAPLLNYREIWDKLQTSPSRKIASEELDISYNKISQIDRKLNHYFEEGALDDWLRVTEILGSIQRQRRRNLGILLEATFDHRHDRLLMELRQIFVEYVRDPVNNEPPTNEEINWVYQELVYEEEKNGKEERNEEKPPTPYQAISNIIDSAGSRNFSRSQGAWGQFEHECAEITGCGWKMGMCRSSSGKDNAINRMYTTGAIRSYPETLIHCLFIDDYLEEMTEVYRSEFGSKLRSSPMMILVQKRKQESPWTATRILVQDRHPLMPLTRNQIEDMFPNAEIIRIITEPLNLTDGWKDAPSESDKNPEQVQGRTKVEHLTDHETEPPNKSPGRPRNEDKMNQAILLLRDGHTSSEVADIVGAHQVTVRRWAAKAGIKGKRGPKVKGRAMDKARMLLTEGKTIQETAEQLDLNPGTVRRWLNDLFVNESHVENETSNHIEDETKIHQRADDTPLEKDLYFEISMKSGVYAEARATGSELVVLAGSTASAKDGPTWTNGRKLRNQLISDGTLIPSAREPSGMFYKFTRDYIFSSPSMAASVVRALQTNGRTAWKLKNSKERYIDIFGRKNKHANAVQEIMSENKTHNHYTLQQTLEEVLQLQKRYSSSPTEDMQERGILIRKVAPSIVRGWISKEEVNFSEGSDGVGRKSRIPWFRVFHQDYSPSATMGWYLVYLFALDGSAVYLSLNQGTTFSTGNDFVTRDVKETQDRVDRARAETVSILDEGDKPTNLLWDIDLRDDKRLAKGYENGNIWAISYKEGLIPDDQELRKDLLKMLTHLQTLYQNSLPHTGTKKWREEVQTRYPNAYKPWTFSDERELSRLFVEGKKIDFLSKKFGRRPGGIRSRLIKIGKLQEN